MSTTVTPSIIVSTTKLRKEVPTSTTRKSVAPLTLSERSMSCVVVGLECLLTREIMETTLEFLFTEESFELNVNRLHVLSCHNHPESGPIGRESIKTKIVEILVNKGH